MSWQDEAISLRKDGLSIRETARKLGVPYSTLWDFLQEKAPQQRTNFKSKQDIVQINTSRFSEGPSIVFLPDAQVKPGIDTEYLRCQGEFLASKKPDVIVCAGDFADMPSLSSYDKGKKSFEGRRIQKDIEAAIDGMNTLLLPVYHAQQEDPYWKPRMVLTLGNHECLPEQTEVLTRRGFVPIRQVTSDDLVAQRGKDGETVWGNPKGFVEKYYTGDIYNFNSRSFSLTCTQKHRVIGELASGKLFDKTADTVGKDFRIISSTKSTGKGVNLSDEEIALGAWMATDSCHQAGRVILYQRESNAYKIRNLLITLGIKYYEKTRDRDIKQICGKILKKRPEKSVEFYIQRGETDSIGVTNNLHLPTWVSDLNAHQWEIFLETCIDADGTLPTKGADSRVFYGKYQICSEMQAAAVVNGWSASLTEYRENQWRVNLYKRNVRRQENICPTIEPFEGMVYCLVTETENFFIRQNNKVSVTGNCRINRHVEANPELSGFLSIDNLRYQEFGWEVYDYLEPVEIGGVTFIHYWPNAFTGKPLGGSAASILKTVGTSIVQGHKQMLDVATRTLHNGVNQWSIIAGASYDFDEEYKGFTGNKHWRGIVVMHNVKNGGFDPLFVSTNYLKERYK